MTADVEVTLTYTPDEARQVVRALRYFNINVSATPHDHDRISLIATALDMRTPVPKPTEPTGLGAVIEDTRGVRFVRTESALGIRNPWSSALHELTLDEIESLAYDEIDVVRVLSKGVTA